MKWLPALLIVLLVGCASPGEQSSDSTVAPSSGSAIEQSNLDLTDETPDPATSEPPSGAESPTQPENKTEFKASSNNLWPSANGMRNFSKMLTETFNANISRPTLLEIQVQDNNTECAYGSLWLWIRVWNETGAVTFEAWDEPKHIVSISQSPAVFTLGSTCEVQIAGSSSERVYEIQGVSRYSEHWSNSTTFEANPLEQGTHHFPVPNRYMSMTMSHSSFPYWFGSANSPRMQIETDGHLDADLINATDTWYRDPVPAPTGITFKTEGMLLGPSRDLSISIAGPAWTDLSEFGVSFD